VQLSTAIKGGGAMSANLCSIEMSNTSIINSTSTNGNGGAILLGLESTLRVGKSSQFVNNKAVKGSGGAIACTECDSILFNQSTAFEHNYARLEGGAVHLVTPANKISSAGSIFIDNTAAGNGGAIHSYQGDWTSTGDRFEENSAVSGSGGALSMTASHLNFDATTTCQNNRAVKGGGGCLVWESEAKNIEDVKWESLNHISTTCNSLTTTQHCLDLLLRHRVSPCTLSI
jgi:predicted outer membrane repeat protein